MARQLKGERMDGTRNETILSLFFLEHRERTIPFESSPHCSPYSFPLFQMLSEEE
jgi:hypothetical protein